jgi:hypothetical protein
MQINKSFEDGLQNGGDFFFIEFFLGDIDEVDDTGFAIFKNDP